MNNMWLPKTKEELNFDVKKKEKDALSSWNNIIHHFLVLWINIRIFVST